jgi:hypothetical protein
VKDQLYWPVYWHETDDGPEHLAFVDDEKMAVAMARMFAATGMQAAVHPPVHLSVFDTFLKGTA